MKHIFTLIFGFLFLVPSFVYGQFPTRTHSGIFLTPEVGVTYTDADVTTRFSLGAGLKFGYTIAKYRAVELDIRGRWFFGSWIGQNKHNSDLSNYSGGVYDEIGTDYKNTLGYTVRNFKTANHNLAVEALLRFNVDAKRKWAPYIFGGIAGSFYKVRGNLLDNSGFIYAYEPDYVPSSQKEYDKILDKTQETYLNGRGLWSAMTANVGIGFSYNVSDGVRIGLEHTMSFTNQDNFDGYIAPKKSFTPNDVYHFTSFYAQFYLRGGKYKEKTRNPSNTNNSTTETTTTPCVSPTIRYYNPARTGEVTEEGNFEFAATVSNVTDKNDIDIVVNGRSIYDFKFNPKNGRISTFEVLNYGANTIVISARNACGADQQTTTITYQKRMPQPPVVYFTNPTNSPYSTTDSRFNLAAKVFYVDGSQNIIFKQNGVVNSNFTFNTSTNDFASYVVLQNGSNVFEITATNPDGSAVATTVIIYGRKVECQNPVISIKQPARAPAYTNSSDYTIIGSVFNVTSSNQISVVVNGKNTTNFTYNTSNQTVTARVILQKGINTVVIKAANACGSTSENLTITYTPVETTQPAPPTVSFIAPYQTNTTVSSGTYNFIATTTQITSASQVSVALNGSKINNFTFQPTTNQITFTGSLIEGYNTAVVTVVNNDGSASATTSVLYRKVATAPTVNFTNPATSPITVTVSTYNVVAKAVNVTLKSQVTLYVNGSKTTLFTFNPSSGEIAYTSILREGSNEFKVEVKTDGGAASDQTVIIYQKRTVIEAPTIKFTSPSTSIEVKTPSYNLIAQTTNVDEKEHISITRNGEGITNFTFNVATQEVRFTSSLAEGNNAFVIVVNSEGGTAQDAVTVKYDKEIIILAPSVSWTAPASPGTITVLNTHTFVAKTSSINDKNKISITLNNNSVSDFSFNTVTGIVSFKSSLNAGSNTATIRVSNESGTASDATSIIYKPITVTECPKPVVTINGKNPTVEVAKDYRLSGTVTNITSAQNIQILVNNKEISTPITYNNKLFSASLLLTAGTNVIEVKATNNCGVVSDFSTVSVETCKIPEIVVISPTRIVNVTQNTTAKVEFGVTNITSKEQLQLMVNGKEQPFTFDAVNSRVTINANLVTGANKAELIAQNNCGGTAKSVTISKMECNKPTLSVTSASIANNGTSTNRYLSLTATVGNITSNSQISVTQNGKAVNFVYNTATNSLTLDLANTLGNNTIVIKLTNDCGVVTYTHTYICQEDPNAKPPVLNFATPTSEVTVESPSFNYSVTTQYVTAKGQLAVKVNGQTVSFNFDVNARKITFSATLQEGKNTAVVYAVTPYGSAEKSAVVNYVKKTPPQIFITSHSCPIQLIAGMNTITGYVINVQNTESVKFYINNTEITNVTKSFLNGKVTFSYTITARTSTMIQNLKITAVNTVATINKECEIKYPSPTNNGSNVTPPSVTKPTTPPSKVNPSEIKITTPPNGNTRPAPTTPPKGVNRGNMRVTP